MPFPRTLADYPFVIVRLDCGLCGRRGRYRLAHLVGRFGAGADLDRIRRELAKPCPRLENSGTAMRPGCQVDYPDLRYGARRPADVPPKA